MTHSQVRFLFLPLPGEVVSGIQAVNNTDQISEGSRPAAPLCDAAGRLFHGRKYESKCKLLRHCSAAEATGGSWLLYKEGSCQDCGPDCKTDRCGYYFLAVISDSSSYLKRSVVMFVANKGGDQMATQTDNLARKQIYIPAARPQEELALRVAAYCRVSSDSEDKLNSFSGQTTL